MGAAGRAAFRAILEDELESVKKVCAIFAALLLSTVCRGEDEPAPSTFSVDGLLMPSAQARLASRAKGVIEEIKREGERVRKGDTVMRLESAMESLQVEQQKHVLDLRTFERSASDELSSKSVISKTEVEEKRVNHEVAKVQLEQVRQMLEMRKVFAPFDGVIAERLRERGEAVDEFTPVINLVNLDELYLEVFLPAARIRQVRVGETVRVRIEGVPEREFAGKVAEVSPSVNPASGDFKVRILMPNPAGELVAGTSASASFGEMK
jgi:membrane fusion protein (multidrug efflux system)